MLSVLRMSSRRIFNRGVHFQAHRPRKAIRLELVFRSPLKYSSHEDTTLPQSLVACNLLFDVRNVVSAEATN